MFAIMGFGCSKLIMGCLKLIRNNKIMIFVEIVILTLFAIFTFTRGNNTPKYESSNPFSKDPNKWTEKDKDYVNNFFEWQHDYYD